MEHSSLHGLVDEDIPLNQAEDDEIYVGKSFGSFEELEQFISRFERDHKQKFWIRSSRSVEAARKILKRPLSENIRYYELQYSCIHGGLEFKTRGKGIRNMSTHKMNCPAKIKLRATPDGNRLEVRSFVSAHEGHAMSEDVFQHLPQNRKKLRARKLRKFLTVDYASGKKRKVPAHLINLVDNENGTSEINVVDEDILKDLISESQDEINKSLLLLRDEYGANTTVLYDDENKFKALYFYTNDMRKSLSAWPEAVYIWGVYNWLSRNYTVMLISIKDSNGMSEVVGIGILSDEDKDALNWFLQTFRGVFKSDEPLPIKCIFSYKSLVENELQSIFPDVPKRVSIYYSTKLFHKIINTESFIISNKEREICTKLFSKMAHNKTFDEFKVIYSLFCKVVPSFIVDYFNQEWEASKGCWTVHSLPPNSIVDSNKNSKEVSLDNRLKQVIPKDSTIFTFIKQLLRWLEALKAEMKYKASVHILKKPVVNPAKGSWQERYSNYLTHYAFNFVSQQVVLSSNSKVLGETEEGSFIVQEDTNCFSVGQDFCQCIDWSSMMLPCRHIISVRDYLGLGFFQESLCNFRWSKEYYLDNRLDINYSADGNPVNKTTTTSTGNGFVQLNDRASNITNQLLSLAFADGKGEERVKTLEKIAHSWSRGYEVTIQTNEPTLNLEEQEVIEEECEFYDHDPETVEAFDPETTIIIETKPTEKDLEEVVKTTIVERPEARLAAPKASVVVKFDNAKFNQTPKLNPLKFAIKKDSDKIKMILGWITKSHELTNEALEGHYVLTSVDIELDPEQIQHSILHESVDLNVIANYLEPQALEDLKACVSRKRIEEVWQCFICELLLDDDCVLCCSCLLWFHPKCVGLPSPQKRKLWFCYNCHETQIPSS
ncbi:hypothetical protein GE061_010904 [Apolygus lucorum]|uniref:SWIM-type domain-containing protein n=1 Tax=Apolygus lucorum TaxID=248454 RepID=A0A8S9XY49_APOLU|nr:hypothetical protein GE061_010904 [Apolygus lucorum]